MIFYLLVLRCASLRGRMTEADLEHALENLRRVPDAITQVIAIKDDIHRQAKEVIMASDLFMIGRGMDYLVLLEGALKLKEISYIHSEAYAAGELKHGPIALITDGTPGHCSSDPDQTDLQGTFQCKRNQGERCQCRAPDQGRTESGLCPER